MESFRSKSQALGYIESGTERGQYQNCGNLFLTETLDLRRGVAYQPCCRENSLAASDSYAAARSTHCPEGCHFFVTKEQGEVKQQQVARQQSIAHKKKWVATAPKVAVRAPFSYFQKLPVVVQSLLIILLIIWLFPRFKDTILEILKALK